MLKSLHTAGVQAYRRQDEEQRWGPMVVPHCNHQGELKAPSPPFTTPIQQLEGPDGWSVDRSFFWAIRLLVYFILFYFIFTTTTVSLCLVCVSHSARLSLHTILIPITIFEDIPALQARALKFQGLILPKDTQLVTGQDRVWTQSRLILRLHFPSGWL